MIYLAYQPDYCTENSTVFILKTSELYLLDGEKHWQLIPNDKSDTYPLSVVNIYFNEKNHLICELSNDQIIDSGEIPVPYVSLIQCGDSSVEN